MSGTDLPGPLIARAWRVDRPVDPVDVAGPGGFVWESAGQIVAGRGEALRLPLRDLPEAACRLQEALAAVCFEGAEGGRDDAGAPGPAALAALPFAPRAPASAVVPALQLRQQAEGVRWLVAVATDARALPSRCPDLGGGQPIAATSKRRPTRHELCAVEDPEAWMATVAQAREEIRAGALRKVVLARAIDLLTDVDLDVGAVLRRLRAVYPTCLRFAVDGPGQHHLAQRTGADLVPGLGHGRHPRLGILDRAQLLSLIHI